MPIQNPESARYNSFQEFISFSKSKDNSPSFSNLFSVKFATPRMMQNGGGNFNTNRMQVEGNRELDLLLDYYANTVQLPSKQITTGQVAPVGSPFKYATNTAFSQININFLIPRSMRTRVFFERWTQLMANDASQYTRYYKEYVCPVLAIYKWERGGGDYVYTDPTLIRALRQAGNPFLLSRKYKLTGVYLLSNLFPYNIGSVRLDNAQAKTLQMQVGFYYERYRFFTEDQFDDPGLVRELTTPSGFDNFTGTETSRNAVELFSGFVSSLATTA
jgi:hypothetical protein|tara:strand:- start:43 stop:864 length:822 start_codon:yes stop_codon:yes gene_type:complete